MLQLYCKESAGGYVRMKSIGVAVAGAHANIKYQVSPQIRRQLMRSYRASINVVLTVATCGSEAAVRISPCCTRACGTAPPCQVCSVLTPSPSGPCCSVCAAGVAGVVTIVLTPHVSKTTAQHSNSTISSSITRARCTQWHLLYLVVHTQHNSSAARS